jgi:hypothetical protein
MECAAASLEHKMYLSAAAGTLTYPQKCTHPLLLARDQMVLFILGVRALSLFDFAECWN